MSETEDRWRAFLSTPLNVLAAGVMRDPWVGRRVGAYEIIARLGVGGMAEVYRARDARLGRDVAIKVLPASFSADQERLVRFEREARVLAALNHPNIGAIYGIEDVALSDPPRSATMLVLELVDGETVAQRIARGPLSIPEAIGIAKQVAEGLEAAHDKGIIHRDLKPANIALAATGVVKLLDFGLAKPSLASPALEQVSTDPSGPASVLGTAPYMSPEQARGQVVDKRTDIWSFGCVLFEMLTRQRPFGGDTAFDNIAAILEHEPAWSALPAAVPAHIQRLLRRCLEKDLRRRLHDIADARIELDDAASMPPSVAGPKLRRDVRIGMLAGAIVLAAVMGGFAVWFVTRNVPRVVSVSRFVFSAPPSLPLLGDARIAPDGSFLVYSSGGRLALRRFDRIDASPIAGTTNAFTPFISPDSRWIGYVDNFTLKKVAISGGAPITIAQLPGLPISPAWLDDETVIVASNNGTTGLLSVTAGGADPKVLTTIDRARGERAHIFPSPLPGGHAILFTIAADESANAQVALLNLDSGRRTTLIRGGSDARYVASGHLLFAATGGLSAIRFDLRRGRVIGDPVSVVDHVAMSADGRANASLSESGTLAYVTANANEPPGNTLVWVDRNGNEETISAPPRAYVGPRLSPDGKRIAVEIRDKENDIWVWDLASQTLTRLTFDPAIDRDPVWTPDGRYIVFASSRSGAFDLYARASDGSGSDVRLTASTHSEYAAQVTSDGLFIIGFEVRPRTAFDVVRFALNGQMGVGAGVLRTEPLIETPADDRNGELSPDGRYLAYQSNESGQFEIYVSPFPHVESGRWQVSTNFGKGPSWAKSGNELFYMDRTNHLMAVPVDTHGGTFKAGAAAMIVRTPYATPFAWRMYDFTTDATRFVMIKNQFSQTVTPAIVIVQNWVEELERLVPPR